MESAALSPSLTSLLTASTDALVVVASDANVVAWNPAAASIFGYEASDVVGQSIKRLFSHASRGEAERLQEAIISGQRDSDVWIAVWSARAHDALEVALTPLRDDDGAVDGAVLHVRRRDIGSSEGSLKQALVHAGHAPRSSAGSPGERWDAERLNLALAAARLGDWSWDARSDIVSLSQRAAELFDIRPGPTMTWAAMRELLHPDDREPARIAVEDAIASRDDYALEYRLINGNRERWVAASGRAWYDERGTVLGMFGVVQDISKDRLLLRVDDAVRPLVAPDDITYTVARTLGRYLGVNRCAYAFVEDDEDTFILTGNYTDGVQSIVGRYMFRQFGAECLRLMRAGEPYVVEDSEADARIDERDRQSYRLTTIRAVICVPIMKTGRFVAAMAVHTKDPRRWSSPEVELVQQVASRCWESIERARFEHEREGLLHAAEAANRTKDEFLAMLGHELRNPLAPILTALHVMKLRDDGRTDRERTVIERQVAHLTRLVDDLLDVSRITRGKVELKCDIVDLSDVVARAIDVASPLFEQRAHTLDIDVPKSGLTVYGDGERLTQVVSNLLTNAGKYTPHKGTISITATDEDAQIVLRVSDTGIGISKDLLPRVFDLFMQGRQAIDRAHGGLGLGLTIVKNLVERHGGTIAAESEGPDRGSAFTVRLPKASTVLGAPALPVDLPTMAQTPETSDIPVLVVDDNEDAAEMLAAILRIGGFDVHVAHDGPEALRIGAARRFDAALLDIGLPVMDGYELAGRLRELPNLRDIRLVAVTGYGQESDRKRSAAAGFHEHLVKPVDLKMLESLMKRLSDRSRRAES